MVPRQQPITNNQRPNAGFTLVETLVTVFVFSMIVVIIGGVFVSSLDLQRRALNIQLVEENSNFLLEAMAKEIRVSTIGSLNSDCPTLPATVLDITHPVNGSIRYSLSGTTVQRTVNGAVTTISSNAVEFTRLQFCISGTGATDQKQPRVTVLAGIRSTNAKQQAAIDIQTTLSARFLQEP